MKVYINFSNKCELINNHTQSDDRLVNYKYYWKFEGITSEEQFIYRSDCVEIDGLDKIKPIYVVCAMSDTRESEMSDPNFFNGEAVSTTYNVNSDLSVLYTTQSRELAELVKNMVDSVKYEKDNDVFVDGKKIIVPRLKNCVPLIWIVSASVDVPIKRLTKFEQWKAHMVKWWRGY